MSQAVLGKAIGISPQQVQKYETGTNRIGSSRLYQFSQELNVPISYFFDGLPAKISGRQGLARDKGFEGDPLAKRETHQFVRANYNLPNPHLRNQVRRLVKALAGPD